MGDDLSLHHFLQIYGTLPRAGPGGDVHTLRALELAHAEDAGTILDLGCGPGQQTLVIAAGCPDARVVAVDRLPSMVEEASRRIERAGLDHRAIAVVGDMATAPVPPASQDVIWSEGAIYNLGVTEGLETWRPLLRAGGRVAFTEPVWLVESPPSEIERWWTAEYPPISGESVVCHRIELASYRTIGSFVLPASAWWDDYYEPMQRRIEEVRAEQGENAAALEVAAAAEDEIRQFERYSDTYSYAFFIVEPV